MDNQVKLSGSVEFRDQHQRHYGETLICVGRKTCCFLCGCAGQLGASKGNRSVLERHLAENASSSFFQLQTAASRAVPQNFGQRRV